MIQAVSSSRYPYLPVHVQIFVQQVLVLEFDIEPLLDTGFDGGLTVPRNLIPDTIAPFGTSNWTLADETEVQVPAYIGSVTIGNFPPVATLINAPGDEPLLGRDVADTFRILLDHGTQLIIEP